MQLHPQIRHLLMNPDSDSAMAFRNNNPDLWNRAYAAWQQQAQQRQAQQRPSLRRGVSSSSEGGSSERVVNHYHYGRPVYRDKDRVQYTPRARGQMVSPGFEHFSTPAEDYTFGAGKKGDYGKFLDNLDAMRRSSLYNPIGASVGGQSTLRERPRHDLINSAAGRRKQLEYLADLKTQREIDKERELRFLQRYIGN